MKVRAVVEAQVSQLDVLAMRSAAGPTIGNLLPSGLQALPRDVYGQFIVKVATTA